MGNFGTEGATIRIEPTGKINVYVNGGSCGNSIETTVVQLTADTLGADIDDVATIQGDTAVTPYGAGTQGSRSGPMTAGAVNEAGTILRKQIVAMAAHRLEVDEADIELADSRASVRDDPEKSVSFADLAYRSYYEPAQLPPGMAATLEATARFTSQAFIHWANATHACTCEVDVETGQVTLTRYIVSEDVGPMINPNVVEGQIAGGTVQGIGGALLENMVYDDDGNPLSSTFVDYLLPTATDVPPIEYGHVEIPGPGVGGYKGCRRGWRHRVHTRRDQRDQRCARSARRDTHAIAGQPCRDRRIDRTSTKGPLAVELTNEFRVAVPAAKTWEFLTDVERVAPCLPGATLLSVDGDEFTGAVKVKVGPITVSYKGEAAFVEKDAAAQRMVLRANGKETRGNGNAAAVVTAQLKDEGDATNVVITTDLTISGKAAQFGRGVLADVAGNLIGQFAKALEADLLGGPHSAGPNSGATSQPTAAAAADAGDSVDLLKVVAVPMAKRAAPALAALAAGAAIGFLLGRRKRKAQIHPAALKADDLLAALRGSSHEGCRVRLSPP